MEVIFREEYVTGFKIKQTLMDESLSLRFKDVEENERSARNCCIAVNIFVRSCILQTLSTKYSKVRQPGCLLGELVNSCIE